MTAREEYTAEEWATLAMTPFLAGFAVAFSDGGGVLETLRETRAMIVTQATALQRYADNELVSALLRNQSTIEREAQERTQGLAADPQGPQEGYLKAAERTAREAAALLEERSHPRERTGYKRFVLEVALAVAEATRTGGFFSRAPLVDQAESEAIARISGALGIDPLDSGSYEEAADSEPPAADRAPDGAGVEDGPLQPR